MPITEELKRRIVIRAIKNYKNRPNWEDVYVEENYADAIEYMLTNFDRFFGSASGNVSSDVPTGAKIKRLEQGDRSIEYEYSSSTTNALNGLIGSDVVLSTLLGLPLLKAM